jgi:hypothetical protein
MEGVWRIALAVVAASCGRLDFSSVPTPAPDAVARTCWTTPINVSQNAGASYAPSIASDGATIYVAWTDATGYVHDYVNGTENLFFRAVALDGTLGAPPVDIPKAMLGTNRNQFPSLLVTPTGLAMAYSGQHGATIDSDGDARILWVDPAGTPRGTPTVISDDIASPNPGITAQGDAHALVAIPGTSQLVLRVYGKYPWGGIGSWNRGAYFLDATTGARIGPRVCYDNCPLPTRSGHVGGNSGMVYRPAPEDVVAFFEGDNQPYGSQTWKITFRRITRSDAEAGPDLVLDTIDGAPAGQAPHVALAWSDTLGRYVAMWVSWTMSGTYAVSMTTIEGNGAGAGPIVSLGTIAEPATGMRLLHLSNDTYFALMPSTAALYRIQLDAQAHVTRSLAQIEAVPYQQDSMIEDSHGRVIVATNDSATNPDVWLHCYLP